MICCGVVQQIEVMEFGLKSQQQLGLLFVITIILLYNSAQVYEHWTANAIMSGWLAENTEGSVHFEHCRRQGVMFGEDGLFHRTLPSGKGAFPLPSRLRVWGYVVKLILGHKNTWNRQLWVRLLGTSGWMSPVVKILGGGSNPSGLQKVGACGYIVTTGIRSSPLRPSRRCTTPQAI